MVRIILIFSFLFSFLNATVATERVFSKRFSGFNRVITSGTYASLKKLMISKVNLAVVRADLLANIYNGENRFKQFSDYFLVAKMRSDSYLYLITRDRTISSIYDLRNKIVAVGDRNNLAASYLMRVAREYGVSQDINTKAIDREKALNELKSGKIDAIFVFASKKYARYARGLRLNSLPNDFMTVLHRQKGLQKSRVSNVSTLKANNYLIVSNSVGYDELLEIVKKLKRLNFNILDRSNGEFGTVSRDVALILRELKESEESKKLESKKVEAKKQTPKKSVKKVEKKVSEIEFSLIDSSMVKNKLQLYYQITNNTNDTLEMKFLRVETKSYDDYPFKPRHTMRVQEPYLSVDGMGKKIFHIEVARGGELSILVSGDFVFSVNGKIKKFKFFVDGDRR